MLWWRHFIMIKYRLTRINLNNDFNNRRVELKLIASGKVTYCQVHSYRKIDDPQCVAASGRSSARGSETSLGKRIGGLLVNSWQRKRGFFAFQ